MELNQEFTALGVDLGESRPISTRRAVVVVGSHRSGTSALARVLSLVGCDLPKRVMPPLAGSNELGFWEPEAVVQAHEVFLAAIGSSWDDVGALPDGAFTSSAALELRHQLSLLLQAEYGMSPLFVVKDPRISRLLPLWFAVLAELHVAPATVIAVRNPLEVAASLKARDGLTTTKSLLLWLRHVVESEQYSRGRPRSIVMYDELLRDWQRVVSRIGDDLDLAWPGRSHRATVEVERFLSEQHRHHVFDWSDLEGRADVVSWVKEVYFALQASDPVTVLDEVRDALSKADTVFGPIIEEVRLSLDLSRGEALEATATRDALAADVEAANATLEARVAEVQHLQTEIRRLTAAVAATDEHVGARQVEVDALRAQRDGFAREVEVLAGEVERLAAVSEAANSRAAAAEKEAASVRDELIAARVEDERLRDSAQRAASRVVEFQADAKAEREKLLASLDAARADAEKLEGQVAAANAELAALEARAAAEHERLLHQLLEARAEVERLTARVSAGEMAAAAERERILSDLVATQAEARGLAQQLTDREQETNELVLTAEKLLSIADRELMAARTEHERLQAEIANALEEHGQLLLLVERLEAALESSSAASRDGEEAANAATAEMIALRAEFGVERSKLLAELDAARAAIETAHFELLDVQHQFDELKAEAVSEQTALIAARDTACTEAERLVVEREAARHNAELLAACAGELEASLGAHRALVRAFQMVTKRRSRRRRSLSQFCTWLFPPTPRRLNYLRRYLSLRWSRGFDVDSYLLANADVLLAGVNPLMHYVEYGEREGRGVLDPHEPPLLGSERITSEGRTVDIDSARDRDGSPDVTEPVVIGQGEADATSDSSEEVPITAGRDLTGVPEWDDVESSDGPGSTLTEEVRTALEIEFDRDYYVGVHEDIEKSGIDPLEHYFYTGWREGRDPSARFSTSYYLSSNPDVAARELNPLVHYVLAGRREGRHPYPPTGFKRQALANLRPLEEEIARWQEAANVASPVDGASLAARLAACVGTRRHAVVSCSHDNYTQVVGGIQLCISLEQAAFVERDCAYINLHPTQPLPVLSQETEADQLSLAVLCDGKEVGTATADAVGAALAGIRSDHGVDFGLAVHALHGHSPEVIAELYGRLRPRWAWLWLHDYFGVCPSATLLRNKIEPCFAPPPESPGCTICVFGEERLRHLPRFRALLERVPFKLAAPSQFMADRWKLYFGDDRLEITVQENGVLSERSCSPATIPEGPVRAAFLGAPALHKGWDVFLELVRRNAADSRYRFYHFGDGRYRAPDIERREVNVVEQGPLAVVEALRAESIDIAVIWSLWEESFSYTVHEALSAGAAVFTSGSSGNIARIVSTSGEGVVFDSEHELFDAFDGDGTLEFVRSRRAKRRAADFVHSRMTAELARFNA